MEDDVEILKAKLRQAAAVIAQFDPAFLPWPKPEEESIRPEDLNATNDD